MTLAAGSVLLNRYRIEELLGSGGMGAVYHAYDIELRQAVAIKENIVAMPGISLDVIEARRRQFEREAAMLASLRHANIPGVVDHFGTPEGSQYLVMDFVEGQDLAQMIAQKGSLPEAEAIAWIGQVCNALEYLHGQNPPIIHRDIKPQNIKVTSKGHVFLVDFGIAKSGGVDSKTTKGALSVTPGFSPPEQYSMTGTDTRSDIYSLGATLYALLTGQVPPDSVSLQGGEMLLVPPRVMNATISLAVQQAVLKAMEPRRSDRPRTVDEFWRMLNAGSAALEAKTVFLTAQGRQVVARDGQGGLAGAPDIRRIAGAIVRGQHPLRLILLGAVAIAILAVALVLSVSKPQTRRAGDATLPIAAIPVSPMETATEAATVVPPSPAMTATSVDVVFLQTQVTPSMAEPSVTATATADARAMATQRAIDATATRQTANLLDCDKIDFEILQSPDDVQTVAIFVANVELTWRVRNKTTLASCKWGQAGQEIQVLRAVLVGGQSDTGTLVKLKWIQGDEYDLSLNVQLSPGSYRLGWRLFLPKRSSGGPALEARVSIAALTPAPTFTPTPTPTRTPCPLITYSCHCTQICLGRECYPVCDECTKEKCD